jgi:uncharacterized protein YoxC
MMIFTYIKIGIIAALVIVSVYLVWNYKHMQTVIENQKQEIAGLNLRAGVIEEAQKATDEYIKKASTIRRRAASENKEIDKVVGSGDNPAMRDLFIKRGLLEDHRNDSKGGAAGGS